MILNQGYLEYNTFDPQSWIATGENYCQRNHLPVWGFITWISFCLDSHYWSK